MRLCLLFRTILCFALCARTDQQRARRLLVSWHQHLCCDHFASDTRKRGVSLDSQAAPERHIGSKLLLNGAAHSENMCNRRHGCGWSPLTAASALLLVACSLASTTAAGDDPCHGHGSLDPQGRCTCTNSFPQPGASGWTGGDSCWLWMLVHPLPACPAAAQFVPFASTQFPTSCAAGPECLLPVYGGTVDGADMAASCRASGCATLQPNAWVCFAVAAPFK